MIPVIKPRPPLEWNHCFQYLVYADEWTRGLARVAAACGDPGEARRRLAAEVARRERSGRKPPTDRAGNRIAKGYG